MTRRLFAGLVVLFIVILAATIFAFMAHGSFPVINGLVLAVIAVLMIVIWQRRSRR